MSQLSERHRQVVLELFAQRGDRTAALKACGYCEGSSDRNAWAQASRFFADPRIKAAVREHVDDFIDGSEPEIVETIMGLLRGDKVKAADRLRACEMMLSRSRPVVSKHEVKVAHTFENRHDETLQHLRYLISLGTPHEGLVVVFGHSGLGVYMDLLKEQDRKLIEGEAVSNGIV